MDEAFNVLFGELRSLLLDARRWSEAERASAWQELTHLLESARVSDSPRYDELLGYVGSQPFVLSSACPTCREPESLLYMEGIEKEAFFHAHCACTLDASRYVRADCTCGTPLLVLDAETRCPRCHEPVTRHERYNQHLNSSSVGCDTCNRSRRGFFRDASGWTCLSCHAHHKSFQKCDFCSMVIVGGAKPARSWERGCKWCGGPSAFDED